MTDAQKTQYFIEIDGCISLDSHPGPSDAAFAAALEQAHAGTVIRVIVIEGEDPFSETAKRTFYQYHHRERRWMLCGA